MIWKDYELRILQDFLLRCKAQKHNQSGGGAVFQPARRYADYSEYGKRTGVQTVSARKDGRGAYARRADTLRIRERGVQTAYKSRRRAWAKFEPRKRHNIYRRDGDGVTLLSVYGNK